MGGASLLGIGVSGLRVQQAALSVTGHNITNAETEGYSRQRVESSQRTPQFSGVGYLGRGVDITAITRVANEFISNQVRLDTAAYNDVDSFLTQISQVDSLLADQFTGLDSALQSFFSSMHAAANDPGSVPARQLLLSEADGMVDRFGTIDSRLDVQRQATDLQIRAAAQLLSEMAVGVAKLNQSISNSPGRGQGVLPNDLLDQRDLLLKRMSEIVSVRVAEQSDGQVNVFVGKGQPIVTGLTASGLVVTAQGRLTLSHNNAAIADDITETITGGKLGGLVRIRDEVLGVASDYIGRIALGLSDNINQIHKQGVTLDGVFGQNFFRDVNDSAVSKQRIEGVVITDPANPGIMHLDISDVSELKVSGYDLRFTGPTNFEYEISRQSDGQIVSSGKIQTQFPQSINFDGVELVLEGGSYRVGDHYRISPVRNGAEDIARVVSDVRDLALASPVIGNANLSNQGTGVVQGASILDIDNPIFAQVGSLTPPLMIRFTSETSFDVLDISDSGNPVQLSPPLINRSFVPGTENGMLPDSLGQTLVTSSGQSVQGLPSSPTSVRGLTVVPNSYAKENLEFTTSGNNGFALSNTQVALAAGLSARDVANQIAAVPGAIATANTEISIVSIADNATGLDMAVGINGQRFSFSSGMTFNALADAINANTSLASAGLSAVSDGTGLKLRSISGEDIRVHVSGDLTDGLTLENPSGDTLTMTGSGTGTFASVLGTVDVSGGYDFSTAGPYDFDLSVDGGAPVAIALSGNHGNGTAIVAELQAAIDASALGPGNVTVSLSTSGRVRLTNLSLGASGDLTLSNPSPSTLGAVLGMSDGSVQGEDDYQTASIAGSVVVQMDKNVSMKSLIASASGNIFLPQPTASRADLGFQVFMRGKPQSGDTFTLDFNSSGAGDNRNALQMANLQTSAIFGESGATLTESYAELIEFVGGKTSLARVNSDASLALLQQSIAARESNSGVNLDEEAANLVKHEQLYNASAQVISVARDIFDILFNLLS